MNQDFIFETLARIQQLDPQAVIAGGFARDTAFNKTPRDIDIFLHADKASEKDITKLFTGAAWKTKSFSIYGGWSAQGIKVEGTAETGLFKKRVLHRFDIIRTPDPIGEDCAGLFDTFDIGLCMIALRGKKERVVHPSFIADRLRETITVFVERNHDPERLRYTLNEHLPRVQSKFKRWKAEVRWKEASFFTKDQAN